MEGAGIHFFFFGFVDSVYKSQPVFIENPKAQISKNRLWRKIRTGWDKIQVGQDSLGKGWLLQGLGCSIFFFGSVDFGYKSQQDFIENPKIQIGKNRLWRRIRTGWDKIQVGQDGLGKGWLVQGLAYSIFFLALWTLGTSPHKIL